MFLSCDLERPGRFVPDEDRPAQPRCQLREAAPGIHLLVPAAQEGLVRLGVAFTDRRCGGPGYGRSGRNPALDQLPFGDAVHLDAAYRPRLAFPSPGDKRRVAIGKGDEVLVPPYTFIATASAVLRVGATPVFVDVDDNWCMDHRRIRAAITPRTKAIMPVHLYGNVTDMDPIIDLARKHNLYVIEDNAQAFGGAYKGRKTGTLGDVAACSFCQNKTFTTGGEGGMVTTDNEEVAWRCRSFRDHGYDVRERLRLLEMEQKLPYIHTMVGFNYRMTEMQSAIGLAELERMDNWNMPRRKRNAGILMEALAEVPQILHLPVDTPERQNGWYVFPITLDIDALTCDMQTVLAALGAEGAPFWNVFWPQCHTEKAFTKKRGFGDSGFPFTSKEYAEPESVDYAKVEVPNAVWHQSHTFTCFAFPTYTEDDMRQIAHALVKVIKAYSK